MAEVTLDPLDPGDILNAASINTRMDGLRLAVNDVEADALAPGAFNSAHLPSLVRDSKQLIVGSSTALHTYTSAAPTYPAATSWQQIAQGGTPLLLSLAATYAYSADVGGCLVLADIYVKSIRGATVTENGEAWRVFVRIEAKEAAGSWQPIQRSQRWVRSGYANGTPAGPDQLLHIPIRTLITTADMTNNSISQVRATISVNKNTVTASNMEVTLRECSLSAIVLHGPLE